MADAVKTKGKQPPAPAPDLELEEEQGGKKRKKKKKGRGIIGLIILLVLIIAAGVFIYLTMVNDWGGVRTQALTLVNKLDPEFRYLTEQQVTEYKQAVAQLEQDRAQLKADQDLVAQQRAELDARRAELAQQELERQPLYRRNLSEDKLNEIKQTGKIYENMDPAIAAGIMSRLYDETYMAAILYYMSAQSAADVMSNMSAELAARVTTELLRD